MREPCGEGGPIVECVGFAAFGELNLALESVYFFPSREDDFFLLGEADGRPGQLCWIFNRGLSLMELRRAVLFDLR